MTMHISEAAKEHGRELRTALGASPTPRSSVTAPLYDLLPELEDFFTGAIFGDIWSRPQLDLKLRVAIILVTFAALGRDDEIRRYIPYAVHLGWTPQEIGEIFLHTLPYIGAPAALGALRVAVKELTERGLA